jgi:hypothetical protein
MSLSAFNRMRRLKAQQAAEEVAKVKVQCEEKSLDEMTYQELRALAKERQIEDYYKMDTEELREALKESGTEKQNSENDSEGGTNKEGE